ncbi:MAG: cysteine desulfurase family protein [Opitutaceae bacterium]|nr:cysteine desulfurase family protein [Opitutaceae bacterium]
MTYLDHNATSPLLPEARVAWLDAEDRFPGNPSSPHRLGTRADAALDQARQRLAAILGCSPPDIVWTSGATEACNTVLHHTAARASAAPVCVSAIEHPAVLETARHLFRDRLHLIPVGRDGVADLAWLTHHLARERPALVALMAANNETGVLQPWREAQERCTAAGAAFFCDATQWCGRLPARGLGACDFVAGSAHKFGGPRGVGFLKTPSGSPLLPLFHGGQQQEGRRAGTENLPGILALVAAFEACEARLASEGTLPARRAMRDRFERDLLAALPSATVTGAGAERLWNTINVVMPEVADCRQRWVVKLDKAGFAVSTGSACASGSEQPSHVLTAMGRRADEAGRALRFSAGWLTPDSAWHDLLRAIVALQPEMAGTGSVADAR